MALKHRSKRKSPAAPKAPTQRRSPRAVAPAAPKEPVQPSDTAEHPPKEKGPPKPTVRPQKRVFPIVGVGASAGGLDALQELFENMEPDVGLAFVVVTHQHPAHSSLLPELLSKFTRLRVVEAADGLKVEPNCVYVSPPGGYLTLLQGVLHRVKTGAVESPHLPIDHFLRSLAADQKERAICIILSGTGADGTLGLKAIKGESGMTLVQKISSAKYAGMPSSAIATGLADFVLAPAQMASPLVAYAQGPYLSMTSSEDVPEAMPEAMQKIFVALRARTGHDFSSYKSTTIRRRIERRMNLHQIQQPNAYVRYLHENPNEIDILFKELLISVTSFFRDPAAFDVLGKSVLPDLLKSRPDNYTLRIWAPGCATGEEVYSLAILVREVMETTQKHFETQIFGTDLDAEAVESARLGQYPDGIAVDVTPTRLDRFFVRDDHTYRIRKDIREMVLFAVQNVIKDPPFTKLDVISCRNMLIYLNNDLQRRLLPIFHYALKPGGILFLGPSESVGNASDLFEVLDKKWKIFRRKETVIAPHPVMQFSAHTHMARIDENVPSATRPARESNLGAIIERLLLNRFAPPSVVVNDRGDILYIHGRTGDYLEPAAGHPRLNALAMAREGLQLELGAALRQAAAGNCDVTRERVRVRANGDFILVSLNISRISEPDALRGLFLITFRPPPQLPAAKSHSPRKTPPATQVDKLHRELQFAKESLQTTIEELETSNEELKSTNEELQSTNEELQSTNEELETSKEEMQSLNEELTTVNAEMHSKVEELSRANDDMQNLLNSTEIATIFLDNDLNIKRYTETARRLIHLIETDIGRPVGDLASSLAHDTLVPDCREVLRTLVFRQTEVQTKDDHWYLMRIMPYRTSENVIDGLVLTFVDINPVKATEKALARLSRVFLNALDPMLILDLSGKILDLNEETVRVYGWSRAEILGRPFQITVPKESLPLVNDCFERSRNGQEIRNVECLRINKAGQKLRGAFTLLPLANERGQPDALCMIAKHPAA